MPTVVRLSSHEICNAKKPYPQASLENTICVILAARGIRFCPSFNPTMKDMLPPWRVEEDWQTSDTVIWQGDQEQATTSAT